MSTPVQLELAALKRDWIQRTAPAVLDLTRGLPEFTTDDLHEFVESPEHVNWWGVLTARLRNAGQIVRVGARPSKRREANGRLVSVWRAV